MIDKLKDLGHRLTSRKFLLALGSAITFIAQERYTEAAIVVIGYLGVEGAADVAERTKGLK